MKESLVVRFAGLQSRLDQRNPRRFYTELDQTTKCTVAIDIMSVKQYRFCDKSEDDWNIRINVKWQFLTNRCTYSFVWNLPLTIESFSSRWKLPYRCLRSGNSTVLGLALCFLLKNINVTYSPASRVRYRVSVALHYNTVLYNRRSLLLLLHFHFLS